jgi:hypothetical protein
MRLIERRYKRQRIQARADLPRSLKSDVLKNEKGLRLVRINVAKAKSDEHFGVLDSGARLWINHHAR